MSGVSGGVVFAPGSATTGRFGAAVALTAGAVIPAGAWYCPASFSVTPPGGSATTIPGGYCVSDGSTVTLVAAGSIIPIGA